MLYEVITDVIVFHPLEREHIVQIVGVLLKELQGRIGDDHLRVTPAATEFLASKGYDQNFGARPLKRAIQKYSYNFV